MGRRRLDLVLVERGLFESRAKARAAIDAGQVVVDGVAAERASALVDAVAAITAAPAYPWVGRGALKLEHALTIWPIAVEGRTALDVGASTGGFTEVCLARGAAKVFAVDVGHSQLHPRVKADPRVVDLQATDVRALTKAVVGSPDLVVCDLSFISLEKALPAALALAAPGADLVALVKPQFEVGRSKVGRGGVVRKEADRAFAVEGVKRFLKTAGWEVRAAAESPILGGDGNHEWLVWAVKPYSTT